MRIIGGAARGRPLQALGNYDIRPTLDRVREALFNILAGEVAGSHFLDLFAGTGANGLEALSRGAASVTFVDNSAEALRLIGDNLRRIRLEGAVTVLPLSLPEQVGRIPGTYDLIFADPPYGFAEYEALLRGISAGALLAEAGTLVLEHGRRNPPPASAGLVQYRQKKYGESLLSFYRHGDMV